MTQQVPPRQDKAIAADLDSTELEYPLDPQLIATAPAHPRDQAKLMVFHRKCSRIEHRKVADLLDYLEPSGKLIVNETRVAPLRFVARRIADGRETEGLFLGKAAEGRWLALIKGAKRFAEGDELQLCPADGAEVLESDRIKLHARREMAWEISFQSGCDPSIVWERSGRTPLPPYILQARKAEDAGRVGSGESHCESVDRLEYQTVFARTSDMPSCAAPTAGLHFTPELLARIAERGIDRVAIELQVGTGTFRPIEAARLSAHPMHHEHCRISAGNLLRLAEICDDTSLVVGTTSVRLLESIPRPIPSQYLVTARERVAAGCPDDIAMDFSTNILIAPGFDFRWTNRLLTNFHLPRSTLLALVGAIVGMDQLKELYSLAQQERYRFYSFGDAMLILP
jgi:S-adenosylmethionine:tRNA ribosyltransferase-isomerase